MNYGSSRRIGPVTPIQSASRGNAYGPSSSPYAYGSTLPTTPSSNNQSYRFSNGANNASKSWLPPSGSYMGSSGNSTNNPNNRSPYSIYANTNSGLSGARAGDIKSVVDTRLQPMIFGGQPNTMYQPMSSTNNLQPMKENFTNGTTTSNRLDTHSARPNNLDHNSNLISSLEEAAISGQWKSGNEYQNQNPQRQDVVEHPISVGNYQALESVRQQQQVYQQQTMMNKAPQQLNNLQSDSFKTQGSYYVSPRSVNMQSTQNSSGGIDDSRRRQYDSSCNNHYHTCQMTNNGMIPQSATSQMAAAASESQGQAPCPVRRQKSNASRAMIMNNSNNGTRSSGNFVGPQYEKYGFSRMPQASQYDKRKCSMGHTGMGGGEGAAVDRAQQQRPINTPGQQMSIMLSQGSGMYGKHNIQQIQAVDGRSSVTQAGGEPDDGEPNGEEGGVTYIPMSWGELLGGGKDGFQKMQVVMSPPGADSPNQNRQLRLAFGDQKVAPQSGEVPLKIISINPVEGYEMGPVAELHADGTEVTEIKSPNEAVEIKAQAAYGSDPNILLANNQFSHRTESNPASISSVSYIPRYDSQALDSKLVPIQTGSPLNYSSLNPASSTAMRRSDFAGTKFY